MAPKKRKTKEAEQAKSPAVSTVVTRSSEAASARRATPSRSQGASGWCGKSVGYQRHEIPARKKAKRAEKKTKSEDKNAEAENANEEDDDAAENASDDEAKRKSIPIQHR